ncbi:hypothetical protein V3C99_005905 [Haemonchus contortus]
MAVGRTANRLIRSVDGWYSHLCSNSSLHMKASRAQLWAPRMEGFMGVQHSTSLNRTLHGRDNDRSWCCASHLQKLRFRNR